MVARCKHASTHPDMTLDWLDLTMLNRFFLCTGFDTDSGKVTFKETRIMPTSVEMTQWPKEKQFQWFVDQLEKFLLLPENADILTGFRDPGGCVKLLYSLVATRTVKLIR